LPKVRAARGPLRCITLALFGKSQAYESAGTYLGFVPGQGSGTEVTVSRCPFSTQPKNAGLSKMTLAKRFD